MFGFDKKEDLPTGKSVNSESLREQFAVIEKFTEKPDAKEVFKRKSMLTEIARKNSIPQRILDCFRHLGYLESANGKPLKGAIDPGLFFAFLYIALANKKAKNTLEKYIKLDMFHFPDRSAWVDTLHQVYKETGISAPAPVTTAT